jgi:hypothetical protein
MIAIRDTARRERAVLKEHARAISAHYAAIEASEDEPLFSPEAIEQSVAEIVMLADGTWRAGAFLAPDGRPDAGLVRAWARMWQSRLGNGLEAVDKPAIDILGVVNRDSDEEDRVVVRVRLRIYCRPPIAESSVGTTSILMSDGLSGAAAVVWSCSPWAAIRSLGPSSLHR